MIWVVQEEGLEERDRHGLAVGLQRRMPTPLLLNYSPLDFMEQLSEGGAFSGEPFLYSSGPPPPSDILLYILFTALALHLFNEQLRLHSLIQKLKIMCLSCCVDLCEQCRALPQPVETIFCHKEGCFSMTLFFTHFA